jgi:glutaredoxin 2
MAAQQWRLGLTYKGLGQACEVLEQHHDSLFFDHGMAVSGGLLIPAGGRARGAESHALAEIDTLTPGTPGLFTGRIDTPAWQALLRWRARIDPLLVRLRAPVLPAFRGVGDDAATLASYKRSLEYRYGQGLEALSNDRYDAWQQLSALGALPALALHLGRERYYLGGQLSAADLLIACEVFPLQLLDGVTLPLDLLYYIERVEKTAGASLREGLLHSH